jgi:hypothetical protein
MGRITFERHTLKEGEEQPVVRLHRDLAPAIDIRETIESAGFDPNVEVFTGLLEQEWAHGGAVHPYHAIVISGNGDFLPGDEIAVSNESFDSVARL